MKRLPVDKLFETAERARNNGDIGYTDEGDPVLFLDVMVREAKAEIMPAHVPSIYCPKCGTTTPLHMVTSLTHCPFCHKEYEHEG